MSDMAEKKEQVLTQYKLSYDLDVAMMKAGLTKDEKDYLTRDEEFMFRIDYANACLRESLIGTMVDNLHSEDPRISHKAALDLGNVLWPEKFKGKQEDDKNKSLVPDKIVLKGK